MRRGRCSRLPTGPGVALAVKDPLSRWRRAASAGQDVHQQPNRCVPLCCCKASRQPRVAWHEHLNREVKAPCNAPLAPDARDAVPDLSVLKRMAQVGKLPEVGVVQAAGIAVSAHYTAVSQCCGHGAAQLRRHSSWLLCTLCVHLRSWRATVCKRTSG